MHIQNIYKFISVNTLTTVHSYILLICIFVYYLCFIFVNCMLVYITIINIHYPTPIWNWFLLTKTSCTLSYSFFDTRQDYGMKDVQIHKLKNGIFRTIPQLYQKYGILTQKKRERFFRMKER